MAKKPKKLVLVVHGIGEQSPGDTLDELAGAASGNIAARVQSEVRWLRDEYEGYNPRAVELFPCHIRHVDTPKTEIVFSEVYWADLSRGRAGLLATLYELIKGVLGLGHVVRENAQTVHPEKHFLKTLANFFVALLHGPVVGINLLLACGAGVAYLFYLAFGTGVVESAGFGAGIVAFVGAVVAGAGFKLRNYKGSYLFRIFARCLMWLGLGVIALVLAVEYAGFATWLEAFRAANFDGLYEFNPPLRGLSLYALLLIITLHMVWLVTLIVVAIIVAGHIWRYFTSNSDSKTSLYPSICAMMVMLWMLGASIFWSTVGQGPAKAVIEHGLLTEGVRMIVLVLGAAMIIACVAMCVWLGRVAWAKKHGPKNYLHNPVPRLLVNGYIEWTLYVIVLAFAFSALLTVFAANFVSDAQMRSTAAGLSGFLEAGVAPALVIAGVLAAIYSALWKHVSAGIGIGKDVITYFKGEPPAGEREVWTYPLRKRIHDRFNEVMRTMIAAEKPNEVIIISHSQGTVIAIEAMRENLKSLLFTKRGLTVRKLVTMGSPYSHLYTHYFPDKFSVPAELQKKFPVWINIFRVDDFVGTTVGKAKGKWPKNMAVNAKGHTGYWTDDEVLQILNSQVI